MITVLDGFFFHDPSSECSQRRTSTCLNYRNLLTAVFTLTSPHVFLSTGNPFYKQRPFSVDEPSSAQLCKLLEWPVDGETRLCLASCSATDSRGRVSDPKLELRLRLEIIVKSTLGKIIEIVVKLEYQ